MLRIAGFDQPVELGPLLVAEESGPVAGVAQPAVRAGDDLHAAVPDRRCVEGRPHGDLRIAVQVGPAILVPHQVGAGAGGLVHEHRPKAGDCTPLPVHTAAQRGEQRPLEVGTEQRVQLQLLDLAVGQGGALVPGCCSRLVLRRIGRRIELHRHAVVRRRRRTEHDLIDAGAQGVQLFVGQQSAEAKVTPPGGIAAVGHRSTTSFVVPRQAPSMSARHTCASRASSSSGIDSWLVWMSR